MTKAGLQVREVLWSRDALDDLKQTATYIARDSPTAARQVASRIRACGRKLGRAATGRAGRVSGTYEKVVTGLPYILAYVIEPVGAVEAVVVLRVIHGARDWPDEAWPD